MMSVTNDIVPRGSLARSDVRQVITVEVVEFLIRKIRATSRKDRWRDVHEFREVANNLPAGNTSLSDETTMIGLWQSIFQGVNLETAPCSFSFQPWLLAIDRLKIEKLNGRCEANKSNRDPDHPVIPNKTR